MRLTLRTLLAYLDDILDTADADALGAKVRESDFASGLVHRIRSVTGRLRLSAPQVEGRGLGADANSVAEYLDNTLPADRIPEFEKVCLESDMHLSEVASCHQVLTLVLGEPAHVDLNLRNRIHNLPITPPRPLEHAPTREPSRGDEPVGAPRDSSLRRLDAPQRREPTSGSPRQARDSDWRGAPVDEAEAAAIPDYIAAERRTAFPGWLAALVAGFLITAAVLVGVREFLTGSNQESEIAQATPTIPPAQSVVEDSLVENDGSAGGARSISDAQTGETATRDSDFVAPSAPERLAVAPPLAPPVTNLDLASEELASGATDTAPTPEGNDMVGAEMDVDRPRLDALAATGGGQPDALAEAGGANDGAIDNAIDSTNDGARGDNPPAAGAVDVSRPAASIAAVPRDNWPAEEKPKDLGRFASEDQVLAFWNDSKHSWQRLPARAVLVDGVQLRVPTLFRPNLMLSNGVHATLNDRTDVRIEASDDGDLWLVFAYGQAIFSSIGDTRTVSLRLADQPVTVTFGDAQSQFAFELQNQRLPGADPFQPGNTVRRARVWPTSGSIGIGIGDGPAQAVEAGEVWILANGAAVIQKVQKQPDWVSIPSRREIDRLALDRLAPTIKSDRSLTLELFEVVEKNDRRGDRRSLAARVLASLDQFDPLIASFGDKGQHFAWNAHYQELLAALARNPESAERIRESANKYWGANSERLMQMVIGYDSDQLRRVGAARLVEALADEQLEARVIAIETLRRITGKSQLFFPERASGRRREPTRKWQRLLESGEIVYRQWPPSDVAANSP